MKAKLLVLTLCIGLAIAVMGGCAVATSDGGIVGTGNKVDCEAAARKGETPPECEEARKR